ncbi:hypothetical protein [Burkholderia gladioli]|uniref:hypothetical protein n=1 Tax=Burkholderia gladioli TaxID=28095 RepID=UPI003EE10BF3
MEKNAGPHLIAEDTSRLEAREHETVPQSVAFAIEALRRDNVALLRGVEQDDADDVMYQVAGGFDLSDQLRSRPASPISAAIASAPRGSS